MTPATGNGALLSFAIAGLGGVVALDSPAPLAVFVALALCVLGRDEVDAADDAFAADRVECGRDPRCILDDGHDGACVAEIGAVS